MSAAILQEETAGNKVIRFIESFCLVPEGKLVGKPIILLPFQKQFILDVYDNPHKTSRGILSIARKNGKTALIACIVLAHVVGPMKQRNSQVVSGAMSREQAALVFNLAVKMLDLNPAFVGLYKAVPSTKRMTGLVANVEFRALSAEGTTAHGLSPVLAILDEIGQVKGPSSPFIEAITSSQGAHDNPLLLAISTQAASDADCLSLWIDDAIRSGDPHTVCHIYEASGECGLMDKEEWAKANPALGEFRSETDMRDQLSKASRIPALESSARNLFLNQRISLDSVWIAPSIWKENGAIPYMPAFTSGTLVSLGLDLSQRNDLTAAVLSCEDDNGHLHLVPYIFTPQSGLKERENRDRAPYTAWVRDGYMIAVPGAVIDYEYIFRWLSIKLDSMGIRVDVVNFDRWRINEAHNAADRVGFVAPTWEPIGQGYKDMSPLIEYFETMLLQGKVHSGLHPLLNMAAANAIVVRDPAGNRKLDKAKATQRIDPLVAALMSSAPFKTGTLAFDVATLIG